MRCDVCLSDVAVYSVSYAVFLRGKGRSCFFSDGLGSALLDHIMVFDIM
jgi:hypothetical protein